MAGDPSEAIRNLRKKEEEEARAHDIRVLVARGLISDLVTELARVMANRAVTGPEEIRLQDMILKEALHYAKAIQSGPLAIEYMSPVTQARKVAEQSLGVSELNRRVDLDQIEEDVKRELAPIINLPKVKEAL